MYSREYWEDKRLRRTETKKGRMPIKSITFRNEIRNSNCQKIQLVFSIPHTYYNKNARDIIDKLPKFDHFTL